MPPDVLAIPDAVPRAEPRGTRGNPAFYEVFGLFRLAAIIQQIYYRYHHGQTKNPAFRRFWLLVNYFDWRCKRMLSR